jgi:hypothetical protein
VSFQSWRRAESGLFDQPPIRLRRIDQTGFSGIEEDAQSSRGGKATTRRFRLAFTLVDQQQCGTPLLGQLNRLTLAASKMVQFAVGGRRERMNVYPVGEPFDPRLDRKRGFRTSQFFDYAEGNDHSLIEAGENVFALN